jgi:hypothetical protein
VGEASCALPRPGRRLPLPCPYRTLGDFAETVPVGRLPPEVCRPLPVAGYRTHNGSKVQWQEYSTGIEIVTTREQYIRLYANHLGLTTRKRGRVIGLFWRYGDRRKIGEYKTWSAVKRALTKLTVKDTEGNV